jgi:hypothetical protein
MILIAFSVLLAWKNPATGYELDIYTSTPLAIWILLGAAITIGAGIILHQLFTKGYERSNFWLIGLFVMVIARFGLLWIPHVSVYEPFVVRSLRSSMYFSYSELA